jgi:hypothetical protein
MPADAPTILATSGGIREGRRTRWEFSALTDYAIHLSGVTGRAPRVCLVATAQFTEAVSERNGAAAYFVAATAGTPTEDRLDTRRI